MYLSYLNYYTVLNASSSSSHALLTVWSHLYILETQFLCDIEQNK